MWPIVAAMGTSALIGAAAGAGFGFPYTMSMAAGYQAGQETTSDARLALEAKEYAVTAKYKQYINSEMDELDARRELDQYADSVLYKTYWNLLSWTYQRAFNNIMDTSTMSGKVNYVFY